jgi:protein eyes shut
MMMMMISRREFSHHPLFRVFSLLTLHSNTNISHFSYLTSPLGSGNKCHNGGLCVEGRGLDFTCECADGWTGRFCSINIDECESSPCLNGAVCIDKIAGYACSCSKEYTGTNCEESIKVCNDSPCKNSALCLMEEGQPICYCVPDFHGEKCEYQYDECQIGPR